MRVLQILDNLSVDSGVTSMVMNIYRNINKENIQFDFLVCKKENTEQNTYYNEIISAGGKVYFCENPLSLSSLWDSIKKIKKFFVEHGSEYQIVHLHSSTISYFVLKCAKKNGIKYRIIHSHSSMSSSNVIKSFINRFLQGGKRYANVFWTCSPEAAEFLYGKKFLAKHDVEMIRNAVDNAKFTFDKDVRYSLRKELGLETKKIITHISNFSAIKNVFFLLPVIQQVVNKDSDFLFLFVGEGPTKNELENKVNELGLDGNVRFVGRQQDIRKFLCASDFLLLPSLKEGLPVVTIEAQACGLPCLVHDAVTKECNIGLVQFLELSESLWVDKILNCVFQSDCDRLKRTESFSDSPYNAANEAKRVEKLYSGLL